MLSDVATGGQRIVLFVFGVAALSFCVFSGCFEEGSKQGPISVLRLATTTSTRDSELLDVLLPVFETSHHCRVDVIAVGTGAALKLGEAGDVDMVLVHARQAEMEFMEAKHGIRHEEFMHNHFVILGPENDPASIRGIAPIEALRRIANGKFKFVSRGDQSGTHMREVALWEAGGGRPTWDDYIESGQGMGPTLVMADEKQSYTIADGGTFLKFRDRISLVSLAATDNGLRNPYAAIVVNPQKHTKINASLANKMVDFLISEQTQHSIESYQISGKQLFHPSRLQEAR